MKENVKAYLDLTLAMVIVGSSVVVCKIITHEFPLFLASAIRFGLASALLAILFRKEFRKLASIGRKDWTIVIVMAICGQFVFTLFILWGMRFTSGAEAGLITSTTPAVMALISFLLLGERLTLPVVVGAALAFLGVLVVTDPFASTQNASEEGRWFGNLLICIAVLGEGVFLMLRKTVSPALSDLSLTTGLCLVGFILFLPMATYEAWGFDFSSVGRSAWIAMAYFAAIFTVLAYVLWFRGVARVPGGTAGIFTAVMPVSAVVLSYLFLGEAFKWSHLLGGLMIVTSIAVITLGSETRKETPSPVTS